MRQCVLAALAAACVAGASPAFAADIPVNPPVYKAPAAVVAYNWSGFYVGGHGGGDQQRTCEVSTRSSTGRVGEGPVFTTTTTSSEGCHHGTGGEGGGQVGVNLQSGSVVI